MKKLAAHKVRAPSPCMATSHRASASAPSPASSAATTTPSSPPTSLPGSTSTTSHTGSTSTPPRTATPTSTAPAAPAAPELRDRRQLRPPGPAPRDAEDRDGARASQGVRLGPGSSTPLASAPPRGRRQELQRQRARQAEEPQLRQRRPEDLQRAAPAATAEAGVAARLGGGALAARRLHPSGLSEIDLPEADRLGGHLDAFVLAQELEGLFEGEPSGRARGGRAGRLPRRGRSSMLFPIALTSMSRPVSSRRSPSPRRRPLRVRRRAFPRSCRPNRRRPRSSRAGRRPASRVGRARRSPTHGSQSSKT